MYIGKLTMVQQTASSRETASHAIQYLLGALRMNGQICERDWFIAVTPEGYEVTVLLPEKTALEPAHRNRYVRQALQQLQETGLAEPECTVAEDVDNEGACECKHPHSFILFTHCLSLDSPLRCGSCFLPVPLYRIPPERETEEYYDMICWQSDYQACDTLQLHCTTLERAATQQMSRLNSRLSQAGLTICRRIYEVTQIPTYYYLYRYGARSGQQELRRLCPSCGGEWLLQGPWHLFDFKCDGCRLVSNIAWKVRSDDWKPG